MNTDTPETDQWETYCDECYYHMWRLRRKTERGWHDGFHINTGEEAKGLCDLLNNLERERDKARRQLAEIEDRMRVELGGHPDSKLWGDAGLIAATMRCVDALGEVTDQRDRAKKDSTYWMAIADEARAETIRWMSIAEGRGRTDDDDTGKSHGEVESLTTKP